MAEFIEKGYVSGHGTAQEWYDRGIRMSMETVDDIAVLHRYLIMMK
jgi:hypothetical protein